MRWTRRRKYKIPNSAIKAMAPIANDAPKRFSCPAGKRVFDSSGVPPCAITIPLSINAEPHAAQTRFPTGLYSSQFGHRRLAILYSNSTR
jgi:hypothetical protein